jgi:hypothetical protein
MRAVRLDDRRLYYAVQVRFPNWKSTIAGAGGATTRRL